MTTTFSRFYAYLGRGKMYNAISGAFASLPPVEVVTEMVAACERMDVQAALSDFQNWECSDKAECSVSFSSKGWGDPTISIRFVTVTSQREVTILKSGIFPWSVEINFGQGGSENAASEIISYLFESNQKDDDNVHPRAVLLGSEDDAIPLSAAHFRYEAYRWEYVG